ncbi:FCD domain-containing protein [Actinomadura sp. LD22]|uniref:FCD domain-containing protein n=1 Tax=Actinomadura physcomitrii TaxID=2650748 RepID=A0A6I4M1N9_9ACTN|nr:GntR family transcriptional regulator [Actinomadura physcomitrii]MVZ99857.1 FCD domain-containing protein [Actinomadura physcomitrii]
MAETERDPFPVKLLGRAQTRLADDVAHVLRDLILRGELEPGSRLLQIQLSERLGVSRTPLREAFRILERDGLLRISNGNKTVEVVELGKEPLIETYQVREVIDGLAARLAARRELSGEQRDRIEQAIKRMESAACSTLDIAAHSEAHAEFHLAIMAASGNSRLSEYEPMVRISSQVQVIQLLQRDDTGQSASALHDAVRAGDEHHLKIFDAIVAGDARAAERAAIQHIRTTIKFLENLEAKGGTGKAAV